MIIKLTKEGDVTQYIRTDSVQLERLASGSISVTVGYADEFRTLIGTADGNSSWRRLKIMDGDTVVETIIP